jgi:hypothetical protein
MSVEHYREKSRDRVRGNCQHCGIYRWTLHRDHIEPVALGGSDDEENIQYICANCHEDKTREDIIRIAKERPGLMGGATWTEEMKEKVRQSNLKAWTPEKREEHRRIQKEAWARRKQE